MKATATSHRTRIGRQTARSDCALNGQMCLDPQVVTLPCDCSSSAVRPAAGGNGLHSVARSRLPDCHGSFSAALASWVGRGARCRFPRPGGGAPCDTKQLQTEQNTELVIHYGWHPWAGKRVQLVQPIQRGSELSLRVECLIGRRVRRVDIPCWMFDRATCVTMVVRHDPIVFFESLARLRRLLSSTVGRPVERAVEQEHFPSPVAGDAHEKTSPAKPQARTTRTVRRKTKTSDVGKSSSRNKATNQRHDRADVPAAPAGKRLKR